MRVALVGCGKAKLARPAPARELYISTLFRLASQYAERGFDRWVILSAKHGVLLPDEVIEPYEARLGTRPDERYAFGSLVHALLLNRDVGPDADLYVLAGDDYVQPLRNFRKRVFDPMAGLGIGERLSWLKARIAELVQAKVAAQTGSLFPEGG